MSQSIDDLLASLIHTYLAKIDKPVNNTEKEAYDKKEVYHERPY
jgi:hypothetical protein